MVSNPIVQKCRVLDCVIVPGKKEPMKISTVDLDLSALQCEMPMKAEDMVWNARRRFKARQVREVSKSSKWAEEMTMAEHFTSREDIKTARDAFEDRFFQIFGMA